MIEIRRSNIEDLPILERIEQVCFTQAMRSPTGTLKRSLTSKAQEVWLVESQNDNENSKKEIVAELILHLRKNSVRIYSVAVLPEHRGKGLGKILLDHAFSLGKKRGAHKVCLEVNTKDSNLINWYQNSGFKISKEMKNYYCQDEHAFQMNSILSHKNKEINYLVVTDEIERIKLNFENLKVISPLDYLKDESIQKFKNAKVINLCRSYKYQSLGYYVSLLASARGHRAIPSITAIKDFKSILIMRSITSDFDELIQKSFENCPDDKTAIISYFGQTDREDCAKLAKKLFQFFEVPFFKARFIKKDKWMVHSISPISLYDLDESEDEKINEYINNFFSKKRSVKSRLKNYKYDLAILIDPHAANSPSGPAALKELKRAAGKVGFFVEFITKNDFDRISEFDALFIRATTNVNDYTYNFSRMAYAEGLVVMDDPWSIVRCSNKIYLNELMTQKMINVPKSQVLVKGDFKKEHAKKLVYPLVLKEPDGAFSLGVSKVNNCDEMISKVNELFKKSDLIIAQEFLASEFDWRIGVLDEKPLFALKYFMAKGHWQIYDWKSTKKKNYGKSMAIALDEVPADVMDMAIKATSAIGDGLYGVDIKVVNNKPFLIEVNDNPNIDVGCEDAMMDDELYLKIMQSLYNRIEMARKNSRFVSVDAH